MCRNLGDVEASLLRSPFGVRVTPSEGSKELLLQYESPLTRTRVALKIEGFDPEDIPPAFAQRLQDSLARCGQHIASTVMWRGCVELVTELYTPFPPPSKTSFDVLEDSRAGGRTLLSVSGPHSRVVSSGDAAALEAVLTALHLPFQPGHRVKAQVDGRLYLIVRNDQVGPADWTVELQASAAPPPVRLHSVNPLAMVLRTAVRNAPIKLYVGGKGLTGTPPGTEEPQLSFSVQVQGRRMPCRHMVMDARPASAPFTAGCLTDSWVQVEVPPLGPAASPGLMMLECRASAPRVCSGRVGGTRGTGGTDVAHSVVPILLLDSPLMAEELHELQREVQQVCVSGHGATGVEVATAALSELTSFVMDLGQWLEWVDCRSVAVSPETGGAAADGMHSGVGPATSCAGGRPGGRGGDAFDEEEEIMSEVARALLEAARRRGWKHTGAHIVLGMTRANIPVDTAASHRGSESQVDVCTAEQLTSRTLAVQAVRSPVLQRLAAAASLVLSGARGREPGEGPLAHGPRPGEVQVVEWSAVLSEVCRAFSVASRSWWLLALVCYFLVTLHS